MAKKYILALDPPIFNTLEEVANYVQLLQTRDPDLDLTTIIVGTYIGIIEKKTSFLLKNGEKIKKLKETVAKKETEAEIKEEVEVTPVEKTCSFCSKLAIKTFYFENSPTHMCEDHLFVEKELNNG